MKKDIENVTNGLREALLKEIEGCSKSTPLESILEEKIIASSGEKVKLLDKLETLSICLKLKVVGGNPWVRFAECLANENSLEELIKYLEYVREKVEKSDFVIFASEQVSEFSILRGESNVFLVMPAN